jgi:putative protease
MSGAIIIHHLICVNSEHQDIAPAKMLHPRFFAFFLLAISLFFAKIFTAWKPFRREGTPSETCGQDLSEGGVLMVRKQKAPVKKKTKEKKRNSRTPSKRTTLAEKSTRTKSAERSPKKPTKKSTRKKTTAKKSAQGAGMPSRTIVSKKPLIVEPGPSSGSIPPVEEPFPHEQAVGVVTHYYSHLGVAVIQVNTGLIKTGDRIRIKGHTTDFTQAVGSMEYEHQHVEDATAGQSVGVKVFDHAREHDIVYLVT